MKSEEYVCESQWLCSAAHGNGKAEKGRRAWALHEAQNFVFLAVIMQRYILCCENLVFSLLNGKAIAKNTLVCVQQS